MPLTAKGQEILSKMTGEYGAEKGKRVFYASRNAGKITGVDSAAVAALAGKADAILAKCDAKNKDTIKGLEQDLSMAQRQLEGAIRMRDAERIAELRENIEALKDEIAGLRNRKTDSTAFSEGDRVVAKESVQGMTKGETYKITAVHQDRRGMFGTFTTYELDGRLRIANGQFLLKKA